MFTDGQVYLSNRSVLWKCELINEQTYIALHKYVDVDAKSIFGDEQ